ncbi:sulfate/molybdate ABC transporter ATP-binding protein [Acetobacter thailandicus]|uniref:sulfate/molybdate ABC transporter ATP-binding protein n=1 Tax=Acetobacter thailandicus TaxID=1502842 RepID=UPI001BA60164|nr:ATP-binding cassette domain-containing protein [Acetobacter thailandicus]MBS0985234.1 ATP-binding cassette domain-containing protein [Acetobacter thailandicus]
MSVVVENLIRCAPGSERILLSDVSLSVESGAFVALVGPSGAGKTTLLRAIAGLDKYDSGTVSLNGETLVSIQERAGKVGFVFQSYALFPHMTVARNISFGLDVLSKAQRPSASEISARVQELLDLMQIPDLGKAYPSRLSGGQRQRVALARALATRPDVLLLDEPFGALDPIVRRAIRTWLRALHDQLGLTTILVTHDQEEALEVADRIVVMQHGRIVQNASPAQLDEAPETAFVMEFLGEAVSFKGIIQADTGLFIPDEAGVLPFATSCPAGSAEAMIRPFEIFPENAATGGKVALVRHGRRNGFLHYSAQLPERSVPVFFPVHTKHQSVSDSCQGLNIAEARLFRNGQRIV